MDTILAALLMVVIVVIASVMVYAWSTGLLDELLLPIHPVPPAPVWTPRSYNATVLRTYLFSGGGQGNGCPPAGCFGLTLHNTTRAYGPLNLIVWCNYYQPGDNVTVRETSPNNWQIRDAPIGCYNQ